MISAYCDTGLGGETCQMRQESWTRDFMVKPKYLHKDDPEIRNFKPLKISSVNTTRPVKMVLVNYIVVVYGVTMNPCYCTVRGENFLIDDVYPT